MVGLAGALLLAAAVAGAAVLTPGLLFPRHETANGRVLRPAAALTRLGHFPTGGAATPDRRFYWTVSTGRARNDIRIVALDPTPHVVQVVPLPGASGGIAMDPHRRLAYVSGLADSSNPDEQTPRRPGRGGDVVHVFAYGPAGRARETGTIAVPPPASAPAPQSFPPAPDGPRVAWPDRLAISGDGSTLLVPLNLGDAAAIVDVDHRAVRATVPTGHYPYGAAILPGGHTGLVSNEADGTVSVIDLAAGRKVKDIQVAAHLSHPEAIALEPGGRRAFVAVANTDQVAVLDTRRLTVSRVLSVERPEGRGASPVALTADRHRLWVADAGADDIAVFALHQRHVRPFKLIGRVPTAAYPADVQVVPGRSGRRTRLAWIAAKGFGSGANPGGPDPYATSDANLLQHPGTAVLTRGYAGVQPRPSNRRVRRLTRVADRDVRPRREAPPENTPLRPHGPIKHVFYVVRENRTYDQVLGDDPRGDGDAALTLFGRRVTPNIHRLADRFGLLDHVYANSEASIDGHFWTSAGNVSDYVHKNWQQNYAGRERPYDFGAFSVTWPGTGFLFDRAERQHISWFNYGEAVGGVIPIFPDKDRTPRLHAREQAKFEKSDLGAPFGCYPNDAYIGRNSITGKDVYDTIPPPGAAPGSESRLACFRSTFRRQLAKHGVPAFNYLVLSNDHTEGTSPGRRTPRAMVAENDQALGQIVGLVSHSRIWRSSAIFVLEDDSQDGADHVDAHRMPAAVISPFSRRRAVVHRRYDMLSMIRSMELILGMRPLSMMDRLAVPMYDAFAPRRVNAAPYRARRAAYPLEELNPATGANARLARGLRLDHPDEVPQRTLDRMLWRSVHGPGSTLPPPGPNAEPGE